MYEHLDIIFDLYRQMSTMISSQLTQKMVPCSVHIYVLKYLQSSAAYLKVRFDFRGC